MLQREILTYLIRHPEAKDTVEGIMQWWLTAAHSLTSASDVRTVLDHFEDRKWVIVSGSGPANRVYGLDRARLPEIMGWLEN